MKFKFFTVIAAAVFICGGIFTACQSEPEEEKDPLKDISYGDSPQQTLDIYLPVCTADERSETCVVFLHGGFYVAGDKAGYPVFLKNYSYENGLAFASVNYRTLPYALTGGDINIDEMLEDVDSAMPAIRQAAAENGTDITKAIIAGHSAGAHLALLYAYKPGNKPLTIAAVLSLAGPADFSDDEVDGSYKGWTSMTAYDTLAENYDFNDGREVLSRLVSMLTGEDISITQDDFTKQADWETKIKNIVMPISPIHYITEGNAVPPTILVHAEDDNTVPYNDSVRLYEKLGKTSNSGDHKFIPATGGHGLGAETGLGLTAIDFTGDWVETVKTELGKYK